MRVLFILVLISTLSGQIIDHSAVQEFDNIPISYLRLAKELTLSYDHQSHGEQLLAGWDILSQNSDYSWSVSNCQIPSIAWKVCSGHPVNGSCIAYVDHLNYWASETGLNSIRAFLRNHPEIKLATWVWCWQAQQNELVDLYLQVMPQLELEFPNIRFIYQTSHCQYYTGHHATGAESYWDGLGYTVYLNNERIRTFCRINKKILFDFGDIDCWYNGQQAFSFYGGNQFPREHDHYNLEEAGHTSLENCVNKAKAWWYLMAKLSGYQSINKPSNLRMK